MHFLLATEDWPRNECLTWEGVEEQLGLGVEILLGEAAEIPSRSLNSFNKLSVSLASKLSILLF